MKQGLLFIPLIQEDSFEDVLIKVAVFPPLFKEPKWLNLRPPAQQNSSYPTGQVVVKGTN